MQNNDENLQQPNMSSVKSIPLGTVIMMEHPAESYFSENANTIKQLLDEGYVGLYISFQRPFQNVSSFFRDINIDLTKLKFIDAASAFSGENQEEDEHCIRIQEDIKIDELVEAIYTSLPKLSGEKRFIFIDSLTTIALYKPLSETMRFSKFLVRTVKDHTQRVTLIFNVAEDLAQKRFIRDIAFHVDEVINVGGI